MSGTQSILSEIHGLKAKEIQKNIAVNRLEESCQSAWSVGDPTVMYDGAPLRIDQANLEARANAIAR